MSAGVAALDFRQVVNSKLDEAIAITFALAWARHVQPHCFL
jgi:hypothetical protein